MRVPFTNIVIGEKKVAGPTAEGDEKARNLDKLFDLCEASRRKHVREWQDNIDCMYGHTRGGSEFEDKGALGAGRRIPMPPRPQKIEVKDNIALSLLQRGKAVLLDSFGRPVCVPASESPLHRVQAEIGTDFLMYETHRSDERSRQDWELSIAMNMGRALSKMEWDPDLSGEGPNGKLLRNAGDLRRATLDPYQFYVDPWHARFEDAAFVIEVQVRDLDEIEAMYGKRVKPEPHQSATAASDRMLGMGAGTSVGSTPMRENAALLKIFTFRPCDDYPDGYVVHTASGVTLFELEEFPDGFFPYEELAWFQGLGSYPIPFMTPLRILQHYYETVLSQNLELANAQLRGDAAMQGEGLPSWHEDEESGQRTLQIPDGVTQWNLMRYDLNSRSGEWAVAKLLADLERVSGMTAMTGQNPPGTRTIGQLMVLREPSLKGMMFFRERFDRAYARIGFQKVRVAHRHYKTERLVRIVGGNYKVKKVDAFLGADLAGVAEVRTEYLPPMSELEKRMALEELNDKRAFGPFVDQQGQFSVDLMAAGVRAILNSGIPDAHEHAEKVTYPLSLEDFWEMAAQFQAQQIKGSLAMQALQLAKLQDALNPPPPPEEGGQEVDPRVALLQRVMGGGQAEQPSGTRAAPQTAQEAPQAAGMV